MPETEDARRTITPNAFEVAPELLGRPLAAPWRRGFALLADLVLVFLFTRLGSLSAALAASVVFFFLVIRKPVERRWLRWTRGIASAAGALALFVGVLVALEWSKADPFTGMTGGQWMDFGIAAGAQDPQAQAQALADLVADMQASGASREQIQPIVDSFQLPPGLMGLVQALVAAGLAEQESPGSGTEEERLQRHVARLQTSVRELYAENRELRDKVDDPSFKRLASALARDLGLTFGWSAVYFTLCLAWWRGRTPGKRLFRLRVLRLDNRR